MKALLALEDGRTFPCRSFTGPGEAWGEVVFNTGMSGYQEVLTDPSYRGQMVTMTYPLIGNYGVNPEDVESDGIQVSAFIIKEYQPFPSNFRSTGTLADYLNSQQIMGIEDLDTRALTRHIRKAGAMRGVMSTDTLDPATLVEKACQAPSLVGRDMVREVTSNEPYFWRNGQKQSCDMPLESMGPGIWQAGDDKKTVVVFDFGVKFNILRNLERVGCEILVVPATTGADMVKTLKPDGVFLSNGPGDPEPLTYAIDTVRELLGFRPIFGICLGIQILGLALGGKTYKLKFGHRGANQPVKNLLSGRVEITSQNHGFVVDTDSLSGQDIDVTHINLNDNTFEGFRHNGYNAFAVQYHPEASPGPHDAEYLFDEFMRRMKDGHA